MWLDMINVFKKDEEYADFVTDYPLYPVADERILRPSEYLTQRESAPLIFISRSLSGLIAVLEAIFSNC